MKALLAALLFAFCLLCPCAHAQQDEAARSRFLAVEAKAKQGDAVAQCELGLYYYNGTGVAKDFVEAVKWYRKAVEQGAAGAQCNLGARYYQGKHYVEAVKWFRKAAAQENATAQFNLGVCYYRGEGVAKDYAEAVKWYRKAAEQGDAGAQFNLGLSYYKGEGVEKDYAEAYAWWNLASKTNKDAAKYRDDLEKKMSPQQVADAQKRTKELRGMIEAKAAK